MPKITLPIDSFGDEIKAAVRDNSVVIITAETGAGKSTRVPQLLLEESYDLVVTEPRRLAVRTVSARVAEEYGTPFGEVVGYRTAYEQQCSAATRCLFVTDGLALVSELMGTGTHGVLVLDEVHEWNLNIEVLVAWAKRQIEKGVDFKVVLMSATLEAGRLSAYFGGAPVIAVPGRTFPVEEQTPSGAKLDDDVANLLRQGRNVLVFQPGKQEIGETIGYLQGLTDLKAEILPLHGELTQEEQAKCFRSYGRPKCVVSTNVAQTSVTIPDIDAVVDSGVERRIELVDGIEGLYLKSVSQADGRQRKGRAGRTKPGVYVDWCQVAWSQRLEFPKAEILRVRLDQAVLRLAEAGIDMEALRFFHQPDLTEIHDAKRALVALGCMDKDGHVTTVGRRVAKMPVSVKYGRMVVEADKLGVVDDVITVAAILEQRGITARVCPTHQKADYKSCACWQRLAPGEETSDVIAQLLAFQACSGMSREEMREGGIFVKAYYQAKEKRRHLADALRGKVREHRSSGKREDILRAVCAGMVDHLYHHEYGVLRNGDGQTRELARESVVIPSEWLIGEPFDPQIKTRRGLATLHLVRMATKVEPNWLAEVAPQLVTVKTGLNPRYDRNQDDVVSTTETWFNGQQVESREALDSNHEEAAKLRREGRNVRQWQNWTDRPEIVLPDPADDGVVISEVVVCIYGADVETRTPLVAYGTVAPYGYRYYSSDPWFKILWTRDENEAERSRQKSVSRLEAIRAEAKAGAERQRKAEEVERLRQAAEPLRGQIAELWRAHGYNYDLPSELRNRMYSGSQLPYTSDPEAVRQWMADTEALVAEVDAELVAVEARKAEAAARLAQLAETARSLRDEVNGLLVEHEGDLSDELYNRLMEFDVDDVYLPAGEVELSEWISRVKATIAETRKYISRFTATPQGGVSDDALAALATRFNRK